MAISRVKAESLEAVFANSGFVHFEMRLVRVLALMHLYPTPGFLKVSRLSRLLNLLFLPISLKSLPTDGLPMSATEPDIAR